MTQTIDGYTCTMLTNDIDIDFLVTVHYFEYSKNYIFEGERHNFWEFLYVDKGEVVIFANDKQYILKQGQIIFHEPNEWHNVMANGKVAPNLVVIAFGSTSPVMEFFHKKILSLDHKLKKYLISIINEASLTYVSKLDDPSLKELIKRDTHSLGSEQFIRNHLELFLLELIRHKDLYRTDVTIDTSIKAYASNDKMRIIHDFLIDNLYRPLSLNDICKNTLLSKSSLQKILKVEVGTSVMDYFKTLKINEAKTLIREGNHNFTEISELLGYNSIHYFSRIFKSTTGMTLSEYSGSVKAHLKNPE